MSKGDKELQKVFSELEPRLKGLGFPGERRGFSPHITVARVKSGRNREALNSAIMDMTDREFGTMMVDSIQLKKSVLTPKGPVYSTIHELKAKQ
jgi:2'-5' RNA ligase